MVLFNYSTKELTAKIVYYGPGLCGKTTNLQFIHQNLSDNVKGKMLSLATKTDRTLFFDFLPMDLGEIRGMKTRMQLYTVPGQVFYNETRKLVLKGVDGIVFVADSQKEMLGANIESFKNLEENLRTHGLDLAQMPHVIQFNKRDLPKISSMEELNAAINKFNAPFYETVATTGIGVQDSLKAITKLVLLHLTKKYDPRAGASRPAAAAAASPAPAATAQRATATVGVSAPTASAASPATAGGGRGADPGRSIPLSTDDGHPSMPDVDLKLPVTDDTSIAGDADIDLLGADIGDSGAGDVPIASSSVDSFESSDIDGLVDEVQQAEATPPVEAPAPAKRKKKRGRAAKKAQAKTHSETQKVETQKVEPEVRVDFESVRDEGAVALASQVLSDHDLFNDPDLEIAQLAAGQAREIVIPVEILGDAENVRRYRLSLRLKLDPVD